MTPVELGVIVRRLAAWIEDAADRRVADDVRALADWRAVREELGALVQGRGPEKETP